MFQETERQSLKDELIKGQKSKNQHVNKIDLGHDSFMIHLNFVELH